MTKETTDYDQFSTSFSSVIVHSVRILAQPGLGLNRKTGRKREREEKKRWREKEIKSIKDRERPKEIQSIGAELENRDTLKSVNGVEYYVVTMGDFCVTSTSNEPERVGTERNEWDR